MDDDRDGGDGGEGESLVYVCHSAWHCGGAAAETASLEAGPRSTAEESAHGGQRNFDRR